MESMGYAAHDEDMVQQMSVISIRLHHRGFLESSRLVLKARDLVMDKIDRKFLKLESSESK